MAQAMTPPRQVLPGTTYLVTRRCAQREFLLKPSERTTAIFKYVPLDPTLAQQIAPRLMAEVEQLQAELARARADAFAEAAVHLAERLSTVRTYGGACGACRDGEASAMLAWLHRAAGIGG